VRFDAAGNTLVELGPLDLAPYQSRVIAVAARLAVSAAPRSSHDGRPDSRFLEPQPFIESDDPRVAELARTLRGDDALASARAIYEWVRKNLSYAGYIADELGARYALENRRGDCTEYADLAAALARSLDIPARVLGGYVLESDAVLRAGDYHNWTEVWTGDRWVLLDAQKEHFGEAAERYIAFHILTSQSNDSLQGAERFRADEGLVVRWN
jgi:transglutaminase-like putative cysteine protease